MAACFDNRSAATLLSSFVKSLVYEEPQLMPNLLRRGSPPAFQPARFAVRGLAAALLIGASLAAGCGKKAPVAASGSSGPSALVVEVRKVEPTPFRETLLATGTLLANEVVTLQAETAGIVTGIHFEEGRPVKTGDVLVELDEVELQARAARAEAELALASALEKRQRDLMLANAISSADYDQAAANLSVARAETELVRAQLAKRKIRAPFDGVVGLRRISAGAYLTPGAAIGTLQDLSSLKLDFSVPERYYVHLRAGREVRFRMAGRNDVFTARIVAVEPSADVATRSILVRAAMPNQAGLLPGAFVEVEVALDEVPDALLIPPIALVPGLSRQIVYVLRDGVAEEREVRPGMRTPTAVQILEGLRPGDEIITSGVLLLRPGMKVQTRAPDGSGQGNT